MVPPFDFFGTVRLFENFLMSSKGPPFEFLLFCNRMHVWKSKRVPSFTFFGTVRHFSKISSFFPKMFCAF